MSLSPEERRKIYEEEKARIEAREQLEQEKKVTSSETSTGLMPNVASLLCYLGGWVTGIIFFIIEQKNTTVRFHAAQSIIVFGSITVIGTLLNLIPFAGDVLATLIGIAAFILWIILMVKAYSGEVFRLGGVAELAEKMVGSGIFVSETKTAPSKETQETKETGSSQPFVETRVKEHAVFPPVNLDHEIGRKIEEYINRKRGGRIAGSAFTIAFNIALLIFFNYFNDYVAYYSKDTVGGVLVWTRTPFFTEDIDLWLPILTTALIVSIIGHVMVIAFDKYVLREIIMIIIDVFALISTITLLSVFPFDFTVIPSITAADLTDISLHVVLICVCVGIGIGILVRLIKFLVNLAKGHTTYESAT
ncbi:MAG: hypothetical protein JW712_12055 [Dehalococcoidales bacterium]|nr:hypothetical protein [Dehalococcoidales bacterium]